MSKPNVIFFFSDQQRHDSMGCYGQKLNVTPNLDRLAADGVCFEQAYTCQPLCGPARSCIQTGIYATQSGCFSNMISPDFSKKMLADYFNDAGYETAYVGKWHLASNRPKGEMYGTIAIPKERRGGYKDYWMASDFFAHTSRGYNGYLFDQDNRKHEFIGYRADCVTNYAIDYLHHKKDDTPFFLFISHVEPHQQQLGRNECPDGTSVLFKDFERPGDLPEGVGDWEARFADYLACCNSLDYNVGRLVNTLKEMGVYDNTIIIYTSDHACHFQTRNREYKRSCHDNSTHIPLVISGPGFKGGKRIKELVSLIDLPATLLDIAGVEIPEEFQGNSLKALVDGTASEWPDDVFIQISTLEIGRAIRTKDYKYSVRAEGDGFTQPDAKVYYEDYLYDLNKDPYEQNNLVESEDYAQVRKELAERLIRRMVMAEEEEPIILSCRERPKEAE